MCLGSLSCWKTHLQCSYWGKEVVGQNLVIHPPLNTVQSSGPLCREAPPQHDVSTPILHGWDGVLGIVLILLLPPNTASGVYTTWPSPMPPLDHPDGLWQTSDGWTCAGLKRRTLHALQGFNPWRCSVLVMVTVETVVPALFRSLTSSRLIPHLSQDHDTPRGEILHGAPVRGRLTVILNFLHFLIIAPSFVAFSPSCLPIVL